MTQVVCKNLAALLRVLGLLTVAIVAFAYPAQSTLGAAPQRLEGMAYPAARALILSFGWQPSHGDCQGAGISRQICQRFPELDTCSGVELGYCGMRFVRRNRCLILVTIGGPPSVEGLTDTVVDGVQFNRRRCGS